MIEANPVIRKSMCWLAGSVLLVISICLIGLVLMPMAVSAQTATTGIIDIYADQGAVIEVNGRVVGETAVRLESTPMALRIVTRHPNGDRREYLVPNPGLAKTLDYRILPSKKIAIAYSLAMPGYGYWYGGYDGGGHVFAAHSAVLLLSISHWAAYEYFDNLHDRALRNYQRSNNLADIARFRKEVLRYGDYRSFAYKVSTAGAGLLLASQVIGTGFWLFVEPEKGWRAEIKPNLSGAVVRVEW